MTKRLSDGKYYNTVVMGRFTNTFHKRGKRYVLQKEVLCSEK